MRKVVVALMLSVLALAGAACSKKTSSVLEVDPGSRQTSPSDGSGRAAATGAMTPTAKERVALDLLLGEHVVLTAASTSAALAGRTKEFEGAYAALDANSHDVAGAFAAALKRTPTQLYELWNSHVKMFVAYTLSTAKHDRAGQSKALKDLAGYSKAFAALISDALPSLAAGTLEAGLSMHVTTIKRVIDYQAAKSFQMAGLALHAAYSHMDGLAKRIAGALGLAGAVTSEGTELHSTLTRFLGEHAFATSWATGAALAGRSAEFDATAHGWLDQNSRDIAGVIATPLHKTSAQVYEFWINHIGMFVAYTDALIAKNKAAQGKALDDLSGYAKSFGSLINSALPALPSDAVDGLVSEHVASTKAVIDAQSRNDYRREYKLLRLAYKHMDTIGGALAQAVAG